MHLPSDRQVNVKSVLIDWWGAVKPHQGIIGIRKWRLTLDDLPCPHCFPPLGPIPKPAALSLLPTVLPGEAPRGSSGGLCWFSSTPQPLAPQPWLSSQRQRPRVLQESPLSRATARLKGLNFVLIRRKKKKVEMNCKNGSSSFVPIRCTAKANVLHPTD